MYCSNCGKEHDGEVSFCPHCGKPVAQQSVHEQSVKDHGLESKMSTGKFAIIMICSTLVILAIIGMVTLIVFSRDKNESSSNDTRESINTVNNDKHVNRESDAFQVVDYEILEGAQNGDVVSPIKEKDILLDASYIDNARVERDISNYREEYYEIWVKLSPEGTQKLNEITSGMVGKRIAFVSKGILLSYLEVKEPITSGEFIVNGEWPDKSSAEAVADVLNGESDSYNVDNKSDDTSQIVNENDQKSRESMDIMQLDTILSALNVAMAGMEMDGSTPPSLLYDSNGKYVGKQVGYFVSKIYHETADLDTVELKSEAASGGEIYFSIDDLGDGQSQVTVFVSKDGGKSVVDTLYSDNIEKLESTTTRNNPVHVQTSLEEWMERADDTDELASLVNSISLLYGNYIHDINRANPGEDVSYDDGGYIVSLNLVRDYEIKKEDKYYTVYGYFDPTDQEVLNEWYSNSDGEYGAFVLEDTLISKGLYQDIWDCQRMNLGSFLKKKNAKKFVKALMAM